MNVFSFTGRIGKDCESKFTPSGDAITSFTAAVNSGYGDKAITTWVRCSMWGKRGESVAPYLLKGVEVAISGELTNREYTDKDGNKRYSLDVRVNDLTLIGGKKDSGAQNQTPQQKPAQQGDNFSDFQDDIPFMNPYHGIRSLVV